LTPRTSVSIAPGTSMVAVFQGFCAMRGDIRQRRARMVRITRLLIAILWAADNTRCSILLETGIWPSDAALRGAPRLLSGGNRGAHLVQMCLTDLLLHWGNGFANFKAKTASY